MATPLESNISVVSSPAAGGSLASARRKTLIFRMVTAGLLAGCAALVLGGAELFLRLQQHRIQSEDWLDPSLIRYDATLGWSLTPSVRGAHRNHDFSAHYAINAQGFRADTDWSPAPAGRLQAIVGDSFVFGFGVSESETFVHLLNEAARGKAPVINCAVPGFSTDQEIVLIERDVLKLQPETIWLAVYLANDLLDNLFPYPMQVNSPKPYFAWAGDQIELRNVPVAKPASSTRMSASHPEMMTVVLGDEYCRGNWRAKLERRSVLFQLISANLLPAPEFAEQFEPRRREAIRLFWALIHRGLRECAEKGVKLRLILLPGRSLVESPGSVSARFQELFRQSLCAEAESSHQFLLDLADPMRREYKTNHAHWFFPNDGHLTPAGHRKVAELIAPHLVAGP